MFYLDPKVTDIYRINQGKRKSFFKILQIIKVIKENLCLYKFLKTILLFLLVLIISKS